MKRGDIYRVNLDDAEGHEIKKVGRPCVIISATQINRARGTVIIVPLSSKSSPRPPLTVPVYCLGKQAVACCDQIRTVDKSRLGSKPEETFPEAEMEKIEEALRQILQI